jgi:pimeloyl-ACP methyl ester carboxylesterase
MTYLSVNGVAIHFETEGSGPPVVLQHGLTDSLTTWYEYGYVDALAAHHQLILIDSRGHGASDKPHDSAAYAGSTLAMDVVAVLDHLGIAHAGYFGHSMGGRIGILLAHYAPQRISALALARPLPIQRRRLGTGSFRSYSRVRPPCCRPGSGWARSRLK